MPPSCIAEALLLRKRREEKKRGGERERKGGGKKRGKGDATEKKSGKSNEKGENGVDSTSLKLPSICNFYSISHSTTLTNLPPMEGKNPKKGRELGFESGEGT